MISLEWVSDYIDIKSENYVELAKKITKAGINVEKVISKHIDNLVVGKVLECESIPNTHLHKCLVDVGSENLQIVCGASNVRKDMNVVVALVGAKLPKLEINKTTICGVESKGMLCALYELGLEEDTEENHAKGIYEVDSNIKVGSDASKLLGLDSTIYELDIHKHRNNDCYYHIGFAYEIGTILNRKVTLPEREYKVDKSDNVANHLKLLVDTDKCPYYNARIATNVKVGESPEFIKRRLMDAGMRSINNVVDISNYVMLEFGQPLHFFDKDKVGNNVLVRNAYENETIVTLDSKERELLTSDIVITDGVKPICIAGVMGGENTEVDSNTKNILIEAAIFNPVSIRYTSTRLNLKSEASIRYGKGLSFEYTDMALDRACYLLEKYANATIIDGTLKHDKVKKEKQIVKARAKDINNMLGMEISTSDMERELDRLDFKYVLNGDEFTIEVPHRRLDIDPNVNDISEEIGRLYGYDKLPSTIPNLETRIGGYVGDVKYRKLVSKRLRSLGLSETKTYSLVSPAMSSLFKYENKENIVLPNPMSNDKSVLRTTLIPSLINVYNYNKKRKVENINIYEIAKTYDKKYNEESKITCLMEGKYLDNSWKRSEVVDFYLIKGIVEDLINYMGFSGRYEFVQSEIDGLHPYVGAKILIDNKEVGIIGRVHPSILKDNVFVFELSLQSLMNDIKPIKYVMAPLYPDICKDMAFIFDNNITSKEVIDVIKNCAGELLKDVTVFDVFNKPNGLDNKVSLAFHLVFRSDNETLKDDEVTPIFNKIISEVSNRFNANLRDS